MISPPASGALHNDAANLLRLQFDSRARDSSGVQFPVAGLLNSDTQRDAIVNFRNDVLTGTWRNAGIDDDDAPIR